MSKAYKEKITYNLWMDLMKIDLKKLGNFVSQTMEVTDDIMIHILLLT